MDACEMSGETVPLTETGVEGTNTDRQTPTADELYRAAARVLEVAKSHQRTVGTAESCTGGLIAGALTEVPGSSSVVRGGIVSYAIPVKHEVLGVSSVILDDPALGAVSAECAAQMAQGAQRVLGSDVAVSVTGIAGPGGEEPGKPVGTVWFGCATSTSVHTELHTFTGSRAEVRSKAVAMALDLLLQAVAA